MVSPEGRQEDLQGDDAMGQHKDGLVVALPKAGLAEDADSLWEGVRALAERLLALEVKHMVGADFCQRSSGPRNGSNGRRLAAEALLPMGYAAHNSLCKKRLTNLALVSHNHPLLGTSPVPYRVSRR